MTSPQECPTPQSGVRPTLPGACRHALLVPGPAAAALASLTIGVLLALAGCTTYEPIDTNRELEARVREQLGANRDIQIPFEIDDHIRELALLRVNPSGSEHRRTTAILDFVFADLDLQYELVPTRNAIETFRARSGNCLSFVNLFVGIARSVHLNPFYVEVRDLQKWSFRDGVVLSQGHIVAGMYVDGELRTYDFLPYQPKSYRDFDPIDDITAMAHYYNNLGAEALLAGDLETAGRDLDIAVDLAPEFGKAINNYGVYLLRRQRVDDAIALYEKALEVDPTNVAMLSNLARAYQTAGDAMHADELLGQIEDSNQRNPYFFVYRGELALAQGDTATALDYMAQALRRDSNLPEVHVGLAKVYIALGDLKKARHHIERALKLDATHADARTYAVMLEMGPGSLPEP
jgi:Tfp pilus assembly protein PilF